MLGVLENENGEDLPLLFWLAVEWMINRICLLEGRASQVSDGEFLVQRREGILGWVPVPVPV
jgi:hypothetical protein